MKHGRAFIGLGSNMGDRAGFLLLAVRGMLDAGLPVTALSRVYESAHVAVEGFENEAGQTDYLNMVAELRGVLPEPEGLLARLLRIEYALGRRRHDQVKRPRAIDLDVLLYSFDAPTSDDDYADYKHQASRTPDAPRIDVITSNELLVLPHPRLHLRRFVLAPLAELAPHVVHPVTGRTIAGLLNELTDDVTVRRCDFNF